MIISTGMRTDIPAFYAKWFNNRLKDGFVCVRNPYYKNQVTKYVLSPKVVDCICFFYNKIFCKRLEIFLKRDIIFM